MGLDYASDHLWFPGHDSNAIPCTITSVSSFCAGRYDSAWSKLAQQRTYADLKLLKCSSRSYDTLFQWSQTMISKGLSVHVQILLDSAKNQ